MPINTVYATNTTGNRSAFVGLSEIVRLWLSVVDVAKAITAITNILPKCVKKAVKMIQQRQYNLIQRLACLFQDF